MNVGILIPERAFQHWSDRGWTLKAGSFMLSAGSSSSSLPLTASVALEYSLAAVSALEDRWAGQTRADGPALSR